MVLVDQLSGARQPVVQPRLVGRHPSLQMDRAPWHRRASPPHRLRPGGFIASAGPYSNAAAGLLPCAVIASRTSDANLRPSPYHHQCSAVCEDTPNLSPRARVAAAKSPTTSRCGPISPHSTASRRSVHREAVAVLGHGNDVTRTGPRKQVDPCRRIKVLGAKHRNEVLVTKLVLRAIRCDVVL